MGAIILVCIAGFLLGVVGALVVTVIVLAIVGMADGAVRAFQDVED